MGGLGLGWQQKELSSFLPKPSLQFCSTVPSPPPPPPPPPPMLEKLPRNAAGSFVKVFLTMVVVDIVVLFTIIEKLWKDLSNLSWWDRLQPELFISILIFWGFSCKVSDVNNTSTLSPLQINITFCFKSGMICTHFCLLVGNFMVCCWVLLKSFLHALILSLRILVWLSLAAAR